MANNGDTRRVLGTSMTNSALAYQVAKLREGVAYRVPELYQWKAEFCSRTRL